MTRPPPAAQRVPGAGRIRVVGVAVLLALAALLALLTERSNPLQSAWFDGNQRLAPRRVASLPATVVEIEASSLAALGRWPWPRTLLAELVASVQRHRPAAIGIDIVMSESDPLSPDRLLARPDGASGSDVAQRRAPTSNDGVLARVLASAPVVLAVAGMPEPTGMPLRAVPIVVRQAEPRPGVTPAVEPAVVRFAGALTSIDELNRAASGWGLVSADPEAGVIRRIPLVSRIDGTLVPSIAVEMFRVAGRVRSLGLVTAGSTVRGVQIDRSFLATEADGGVRPYFSPRDSDRFVTAVDVLRGKVAPERLRDRLVLIAVTALGLGDYHHTPVGERMPGAEIQAQLLENLFEQTLLVRPAWARLLETAALVIPGALLLWATPQWRPRNAALLALAVLAILLASAHLAFRSHRLLLDAATPGACLMLLFAVTLVLTLGESTRQRKALEAVVQTQREENARIAGELDAARRIQMAMLPRAEVLGDDPRIDLAVSMSPAREVGGDLYDFFRIDDRRLFFLVGDVAGKGLSASIFMAVSKALYKSATLRAPQCGLGELMSTANAEVSRDNPEMLFVTAFAAVVDLESGALDYCNAGHENPCRLHPAATAVDRIVDGDGPPLCAVEDFDYRSGKLRLRPGELLCIVTDGVTEAQNGARELYGRDRLDAVLSRLRTRECSAREVVDAVRADVQAFAGAAEQADDITVLALRWNGPGVDALPTPVS